MNKLTTTAVVAAVLIAALAGSASAQTPTNDAVIPIAVSQVNDAFSETLPLIIGGAATLGALGLGARLFRRMFSWGRTALG